MSAGGPGHFLAEYSIIPRASAENISPVLLPPLGWLPPDGFGCRHRETESLDGIAICDFS